MAASYRGLRIGASANLNKKENKKRRQGWRLAIASDGTFIATRSG
jgi:hypothetical protein